MITTLETPQKSEAFTALDAEKMNEMKRVLQAQGVKFEPKERKVEIPLITDKTLSNLFPERSKESARLAISVLDDYLTGEVILDQWGDDHLARKKWQDEMMKKYPGSFEEVYYRHNLLRSNLMTSAIMAMQQLSKFLNSDWTKTLHAQIKPLVYHLLNEANGQSIGIQYKDMSLYQKIEVVRTFEDKIIDAYKILAGDEAKTVFLNRWETWRYCI